MNIKEFISFTYKGKAPISQYQYVTKHEEAYYVANPEALQEELWVFYFYGFLAEIRPSMTTPFMDFHLHKSYDKRDFLAFVQNSPDLMPYMYVDEYKLYWKDQYITRASEWVEGKKLVIDRMPARVNSVAHTHKIEVHREGESGPVSIWEIEAFFMKRLKRPRKLGSTVIIMEASEVSDFVHANYEGSPNPVARRRFKTNGTQKDILMAVDEFFCRVHTATSSTHEYCHMLIAVFEEFESYIINSEKGEYDVEKLGKNFSRYRVKKWLRKS